MSEDDSESVQHSTWHVLRGGFKNSSSSKKEANILTEIKNYFEKTERDKQSSLKKYTFAITVSGHTKHETISATTRAEAENKIRGQYGKKVKVVMVEENCEDKQV